MPDLNSLPPSSPASFSRAMPSSNTSDNVAVPARGESPSSSPRASISLQAAATVNAGLQHETSRRASSSSSLARNRQSPHSNRRRSQVLMNLQMNDPSVPAPGEMLSDTNPSSQVTASPTITASPLPVSSDPHHHRQPSLGELHQELEAEQEAQVNRLLGMIRHQQLQIQQLQSQQPQSQSAVTGDEASDRSVPTPAQPIPVPGAAPPSVAAAFSPSGSLPRSPVLSHPRSSFDMARADLQRRSRTPSRGASPRLRSTSISADSGDPWLLGGRDESAFYQAETQMLVRENQMLRHRIRELERQLSEMGGPSSPTTAHEPTQHSHLGRSSSISEEESTSGATRAAALSNPLPTVADAPKED